MSVLIIGPTEQDAIAKAMELARDQYLPWSIGKNIAIDDQAKPTAELKLSDRRGGEPASRSQHLMLGTYRCAISFEEQPAGLCRHLSVSVPKRGKVPTELAMQMIAEAFGFHWPGDRIWLEEFEPGHHAINIIEVERGSGK